MLGFEIAESDTLYKIVRLSQFNIRIQSLSLLLQMIDIKEDAPKADRYYRVLYDQLLHLDVATTAHAMQFFNVVHKSLKIDVVLTRVIAFAKRLLQICHHVSPNTACGILFLLSDISKTHRGMLKLSAQSGTSSSTDRLKVQDQIDDSAEEDSDNREDKVAIATKKKKKLEKFLRKTNVRIDGVEGAEDKSDVTQLDETTSIPKAKNVELRVKSKKLKNTEQTTRIPNSTSTQHDDSIQELVQVKEEEEDVKHKVRATSYDATGLNPTYCGADLTLAYELSLLAQHFHPSVALFAQTLLKHQRIKYEGNPLRDFTVTRFLERFIYRNPKVNKVKSTKRSVVETQQEEEAEEDDEEDDEDLEVFEGAYDESDLDDEEAIDADDFIELDGEDNGSDEELQDFDISQAFDGDDDLDMFDGEIQASAKDSKKKKKTSVYKIKRRSGDKMFLPAEQFADMMEENADFDLAGSHTLINKDSSNVKQLQWESDRDRWVKGYKRTSKSSFKSQKSKKRRF